ncbi:hypothetical protein [Clostridium magnum]|uniref:Uncharacterized protein n=1 Tax=Clostridium magnum DSM 2767 TaxID=1121326 RepID=A0A162UUI6_9CLOT|nr:hypothetical protein [Clostridium magnum]KZL94295.1 hypothetical protein CLMAG_13480 [Clostridium magnum DSM 2767]SHH90778.1 hypothetical protein SAMN02745944_01706 [Clostridium magnum DSM 2767]
MGKDSNNKNDLIVELVEKGAQPILSAKSQWYESIFNILSRKKENTENNEEYSLVLKAEIVYLKRLWNKELDVIHEWGQNAQVPEVDEINAIIEKIEEESKTEVVNGKVVFKNGKNLDKNDLAFIERYNTIPDLDERIVGLQEDYIYLKIRDYITLNVYQFISQNQELVIELFKENPKETTQIIGDLASNYADICMFPDMDEN